MTETTTGDGAPVCTHQGCACRLFVIYCWVRGAWHCECMHPKGEHPGVPS